MAEIVNYKYKSLVKLTPGCPWGEFQPFKPFFTLIRELAPMSKTLVKKFLYKDQFTLTGEQNRQGLQS